jgi:hypothetical protein
MGQPGNGSARTFGPPSKAGLPAPAGVLAAEAAIPSDEVAAVNAGVLFRNDRLVQGIPSSYINCDFPG